MKRITLIVAGVLATVALSPAAAQASVLVAAPYPFTKPCGARIEVGIWWRDDGRPTARRVRISIRTRSGRVVWHKSAVATKRWRNWRYKPRCGRRYVVRYSNRVFGVDRFKVRIRG